MIQITPHMRLLVAVEPADFRNELQRHAAEVGQDPAAWMPWNYRLTLESSSDTA